MRLKSFYKFINESKIEDKFLSEETIDYLLQSIKDKYEFDEFTMDCKLFKTLEGVDFSTQTKLDFGADEEEESEVSYEFHDNMLPYRTGHMGYVITLHFEKIPMVNDSIDDSSGFHHSYNESDDEYVTESTEELDNEIERFIKKLKVAFGIKIVEYSAESKTYLTNEVSPKIEIILYDPNETSITLKDFVEYYNITDYVIEGDKICMDVLMTDLTDRFLKDEKQEIWIDQGYVDFDLYHYAIQNDSEACGDINTQNEERIVKYIADKHFDGDDSKLEDQQSNKSSYQPGSRKRYSDLVEYIFGFYNDDEIISEIISLYRDMYIQAMADEDYKILYNEFIEYLSKEYDFNIKMMGYKMDNKSYEFKNSKGSYTSKHEINAEIMRLEIPKDFFDEIEGYSDMDNYKGMSMFELWREIKDPYKQQLTSDGVSYTSIDSISYNTEIENMFKD